jgi:hypothetical protein
VLSLTVIVLWVFCAVAVTVMSAPLRWEPSLLLMCVGVKQTSVDVPPQPLRR